MSGGREESDREVARGVVAPFDELVPIGGEPALDEQTQIRVENTCHSARLALAVDLDKAEQDFIALPVFSLVASRRASGRDLVDGALSARHENTLGFHLKFF